MYDTLRSPIPAVKINRSINTTPGDDSETSSDDEEIPETCVSTKKQHELAPIDSTLFVDSSDSDCHTSDLLSSDEEQQNDDFGEFLLDAVQWL
mmetsp:Transcript_22181/g.62948  ORF Transcript_22181/g.62948 Transcript_22181/m.62948 type:complete len:93 (-) Transcript_22181:38-316(-)